MNWHPDVILALFSSALNAFIGVSAYLRAREHTLYRSLALMSLSFSLWSLGYAIAWLRFPDPFWQVVMMSPLAWLPGASLSFVWAFTEVPERTRRSRVGLLYGAGILALVLLWTGWIDLDQFHAAVIVGGFPIFGLAAWLVVRHWRRAADPGERNRVGYFALAAWIALLGGFSNFLPRLGIAFPPLANISLAAYSLIVLTAIERHHLLDLRVVLARTGAIIASAAALAILLGALTRAAGHLSVSPYLNFFILSLLLVWMVPPFWNWMTRVFDQAGFEDAARRERALERLERSAEGRAEPGEIAKIAAGVLKEELGADAEVEFNPRVLRGWNLSAPLDVSEDGLLEKVDVATHSQLSRQRSQESRELAKALTRRSRRAVVAVRRQEQLVAAVWIGKPRRGFFDSNTVLWLRRFARRLGRAVGAAETARRLLHADRLAQLGTLSAGVAHEIRNPLSAMLGAVELMKLSSDEPQRAEQIEILQEEVRRLDAIVEELLSFSSPNAREAVCQWEAVEGHVLKLMKPELEPGVRIKASGKNMALGVSAPHAQQILINLLKNALRAVSGLSHPQVDIRLANTAEAVRLEVADNGPGIAAEAFESLFTPFATHSPAGTGLGLATVHRLAGLYGGRAWAENGEKGARFFVELPKG